MNKIMRFLTLSAFVAGVSTFGNGCILSECEDEQGNQVDNCVQGESVTIYTGSERDRTVAYSAGMGLEVESVNGKVVVDKHDGSDVLVTFFPKTGGKSGEKEEAKAEMENELQTTASESGGQVVVQTSRTSDNIYLGADVEILLPAAFDGPVDIRQNNRAVDVDLDGLTPSGVTIINDGAGDVDVEGAQGPVEIEGGFDVNATIASWPTADGRIESTGDTGDITVVVPADANGSIQATASDDGVVHEPSTLPDGWTVEAAAENSKTFNFGDGSGGVIQVRTTPDGLGEVTIGTG